MIEQNDSAFRLYEKLGYDVVRWLEVWTLPKGSAPGNTRDVPVEQAHARIRELRKPREPWQRADATLAHLADARGIETDEGAAVFRVTGPAQLIQIAGEARELLQTIRSHGDTMVLNLPADDSAADALRELGGGVMLRQREMVFEP